MGVAVLFIALLDLCFPFIPAGFLAVVRDMPEDIQDLQKADGQILYLGDSVVFRVGPKETEGSLAEMLAQDLSMPVLSVTHGANAMDSFLAQVEYITRARLHPKVIVIPVNLRSFGPEWEFNPYWDFSRRNSMYTRPFLNRLLAVLKYDFGQAKREKMSQRIIDIGGVKFRPFDVARRWLTVGNIRSASLSRAYFLMRYGTDIRTSSRFKDLERLVKLIRDAELCVLFYITPINVESMAQFVEKEQRLHVEENLQALREVFTGSDIEWLDLSHELSSTDFDHPQGNPNEHLASSGRMECARLIAQKLLTIICGGMGGRPLGH